MKTSIASILAGLFVAANVGIAGNAHNQTPRKTDAALQAQVSNILGKSPLAFEANAGQTDAQVKYYARLPGGIVFLTPNAAVFSLSKGKPSDQPAHIVLAMELVGGHADAKWTAENELPSKSNYLIGGDPKQWRTGVAQYAKVRQHGVYPGIDLVYYGNQRQLEYDFVVAPGRDPKAIAFKIKGTKNVAIGKEGDLVMTTAHGELRQNKPQAYQEVNGQRHAVEANYALRKNGKVGFQIGEYDAAQPLIIDPVYNLVYSTYLGGSGQDWGLGITADVQGNAYITGRTGSLDFPGMSGASMQQNSRGRQDAFLVKIDPAGNQILYATYIGGNGDDQGATVNVDSFGNIYIAGETGSANFPGINNQSIFPTIKIALDIFAIKLNAQGNQVLFATYLGGGDSDWINDAAVTDAGKLYLVGYTEFPDFPVTPQAIQPVLKNAIDGSFVHGFITIFDTVNNKLEYSSFLGGEDNDEIQGIEVDAQGNMYLAGGTSSGDFPGTKWSGIRPQNISIQDTRKGKGDAFVVKMDPTGTRLIYSTFLGGSDVDAAYDIAIDAQGNAYVVGNTDSTDFPGTLLSPIKSLLGKNIQPVCRGTDAFVAKINANGGALVYSTYLGGNAYDDADRICVDTSGQAYLVGGTWSSDFPGTPNSQIQPILNEHLQPTIQARADMFLTTINSVGDGIIYSTYLGGPHGAAVTGAALDSHRNIYLTGWTGSLDFTGAAASKIQNHMAGIEDAFGVKIQTVTCPRIFILPDPLPGGTVGINYSQQLSANGGMAPYQFNVIGNLPPGLKFQNGTIFGIPTQPGIYKFTITATDARGCGEVNNNAVIVIGCPQISVLPNPLPNGVVGFNYSQQLSAKGGMAPYQYNVIGNLPPGLKLQNDTIVGTPTIPGTYRFTISATDSLGCQGMNMNAFIVINACPQISILPNPLPSGVVGFNYSQQLRANGGVPPYQFNVIGNLPPGLKLQNDIISGIPVQPGTYRFTLLATDAFGCQGMNTNAFIVINACPLTIIPNVLSSGIVGVPYAEQLGAVGGAAPYIYVDNGKLPPGLVLDKNTGAIMGKPLQAGTFMFAIDVTDVNGCMASKNLSITIVTPCPPFTFQPNALNNGEYLLPYNALVAVNGGVPPYNMQITAGALPTGLSMAWNGLISGTPTVKAGMFTFTITATDFNGCTGSKTYAITIASPKFIFTPTSLPNGYYSFSHFIAPYQQQIMVTGGIAPYTFTSNVKLPPGLMLDKATGIISGRPTASGTFKFVITATDKLGRTGSWDYAITISLI